MVPDFVLSASATLTHGILRGQCIIIAILQLSKVRLREVITCSRSQLMGLLFEPRLDLERQTQEAVEHGVFYNNEEFFVFFFFKSFIFKQTF